MAYSSLPKTLENGSVLGLASTFVAKNDFLISPEKLHFVTPLRQDYNAG